MLGETLGASGSLQAIAMVETMRDGVLPGILNLQEIENDFPFQLATPHNRQIDLQTGLINSLGFDGHCCSLVLARCKEN
jgi:3-oxoacyl-[acyl-carrier-protein] synthase II